MCKRGKHPQLSRASSFNARVFSEVPQSGLEVTSAASACLIYSGPLSAKVGARRCLPGVAEEEFRRTEIVTKNLGKGYFPWQLRWPIRPHGVRSVFRRISGETA